MLIFNLKDVLFVGVLVLAMVMLIRGRKTRPAPVPWFNHPTFHDLIEQAPFGWLLLHSATARYEQANAYSRQLFGLTESAGPLPDTVWVTLLQEACQTSEPYRQLILPSEEIVQWSIFKLGQFHAVFSLDVTANHQASQFGRTLLSNLSHELRTPLAAILTHLEILAMPNLSVDISAQSLTILKQEGQRLSQLVNQLLSLNQLETEEQVEHHYLDLLALVEGVLLELSPIAQSKGMRLMLVADGPLPPIMGDGNRLKQLFLNLVENAIKHTPHGTEIRISLQKKNANIDCLVCDNGPGIPAEHLPYLTHRFYRAAPQQSDGSGLGLALVMEILRQHNSELTLKSEIAGEQRGLQAHFSFAIAPKEEIRL